MPDIATLSSRIWGRNKQILALMVNLSHESWYWHSLKKDYMCLNNCTSNKLWYLLILLASLLPHESFSDTLFNYFTSSVSNYFTTSNVQFFHYRIQVYVSFEHPMQQRFSKNGVPFNLSIPSTYWLDSIDLHQCWCILLIDKETWAISQQG